MDKKIVSTIYANSDIARERFVVAQEKKIEFGGGDEWVDVEADEVDLGRGSVDNPANPKLNKQWEQWCGIVQRGCPSSLRLIPLKPPLMKASHRDQAPLEKRIGHLWLRSFSKDVA